MDVALQRKCNSAMEIILKTWNTELNYCSMEYTRSLLKISTSTNHSLMCRSLMANNGFKHN